MLRASPLSQAARLVLASAGPYGIEFLASTISAPAIDWDLVLALAQREGASGVLWRQLRASALPVPLEHSVRLERLARMMDFQAQYIADRLDETLCELRRVQVPVLLLKGSALSRSVYRSRLDRPMGDIDVLVAPQDLAGAIEAAHAAGWHEDAKRYSPADYAGHQHLAPLVDRRRPGVRLELHTDFSAEASKVGLSRDELVRDALTLDGTDGLVRIPSHLHSLLNLCVHFGWSHAMRFGVWRTLRDAGVLARAISGADGRDWATFVETAIDHRASSCCYWTLRLAGRLSGVEVPEQVLLATAPYRSESWLGSLERHLELQVLPSDASCPSEKLSELLWEAAIRPVRSGHGRERPWDAPLPRRQRARRTVLPLRLRLVRHARGLTVWWRYLQRVLLPETQAT